MSICNRLIEAGHLELQHGRRHRSTAGDLRHDHALQLLERAPFPFGLGALTSACDRQRRQPRRRPLSRRLDPPLLAQLVGMRVLLAPKRGPALQEASEALDVTLAQHACVVVLLDAAVRDQVHGIALRMRSAVVGVDLAEGWLTHDSPLPFHAPPGGVGELVHAEPFEGLDQLGLDLRLALDLFHRITACPRVVHLNLAGIQHGTQRKPMHAVLVVDGDHLLDALAGEEGWLKVAH